MNCVPEKARVIVPSASARELLLRNSLMESGILDMKRPESPSDR